MAQNRKVARCAVHSEVEGGEGVSELSVEGEKE